MRWIAIDFICLNFAPEIGLFADMSTDQSKTVAFHSFGCKLNQSETQTIEAEFKRNGYTVVPFSDVADYYVIDTCTVTDQADAKCRNIIRKAERINPDARVVVTGCMAQMESVRIKEMSPRSLVVGTFEKMNLMSILSDVEASDSWDSAVFIDEHKTFQSSRTAEGSSRTRAFLKIQDGCNYVCSFCIIPYSRGRDRSNAFVATLEEARSLIADGYKEIVLTGVNIGEYKDGEKRVDDVVEAIANLDGLERLRISSIEPNTVTDRLLELIAQHPVIMPHVHVPIQSASDGVLKQMRRHYDRAGIEAILDRICATVPGAALGSDVIVGFPGETDAQFQDTVDLMDRYPFTYFHTFTYSARQKTGAARMPNQISRKVKFERSEYLRKLNRSKRMMFANAFVGETVPVLVESHIDGDGNMYGFTDRYVKVRLAGNPDLGNSVHLVRITGLDGEIAVGETMNEVLTDFIR